MKSLEANQKTLARVLELTTRQVRNLDELGLPSRPAADGKERVYDLAKAVPWYVAYKVAAVRPTERNAADARRAAAQARLAELEVEERESRLIPVNVHRELLARVFDEVRANVLNLPGSIATQLVGLDDAREAVAVLRPAVDRCLVSLVAMADELEQEAEGQDPLPENFPGAKHLEAAGVRSLQALRRRLAELEEIRGIGPKTAQRIRAELEVAA